MRHTAVTNLLNEIEINTYSLPSLMRNSDLSATATDFTAILDSIDFSKFGRFSNVADEIYAKLLWSFHECKLLVVVPDRYGFKFPIIKAAEGKRWTENSTHMHEIETIVN